MMAVDEYFNYKNLVAPILIEKGQYFDHEFADFMLSLPKYAQKLPSFSIQNRCLSFYF